ncbi:hypothetical protein J5N97_014834 [Dioscorea zingiberensis]|uniref:Fe2OG dioxygenase domain-containing protein n=1 Tax=Dioscorea zingiberensis TaxID=325984 RepID=A0A9D5CW18_9LILI|nr:hypothetical protein J5N97_014834 [Dioscorea zingiberensis]
MSSQSDHSYPPLFRRIEPNPVPRSSEDEIGIEIPVIDLESLDDDALTKACREWGLFRLENHGIPPDLSAKLKDEVARLLSLSFEEKESRFHGSSVAYFWGTPAMRSLRSVNWVEGLHIPMDQLRSDVDSAHSALRSLAAEYGEHMAKIARKLFDAVAADLKLESSQLGPYLDESHGTLRVYRYPPCPDLANYYGLEAHTDSSVLSILNQDSVGGLQILHASQWFHVAPVPGTLIVNLGDMLQAISNDKYKSVQHRVLANGDKERMSLCYFAFPREGAVLTSSSYRPFTYQDFSAQVQEDIKALGFKVFFTEEGRHGAWLEGIVIEVGENSRHIEFTHFLTEDEQSKLVDRILVSESIEGFHNPAPREQRGSIRPVPPHCDFPGSGTRYGLCVDVWMNCAWWEGVVFDQNIGSEKRKVFFPDIVEERIVTVNGLRVTQEWEEDSGHWKPRGEWLLLQVLQELEKEGPLPVSIRQIWYDLRSNVAFLEKIGSWTSGSYSIWYGLVSELYQELQSVADDRAVSGMTSADQLIDTSMICQDVNRRSLLEEFLQTDSADSLLGSVDNLDGINIADLPAADDHTLIEHGNDNLRPEIGHTVDNDDVEHKVKGDEDNLKQRVGKSWQPVKFEAKQCSESITSYYTRSTKHKLPSRVYEDMKLKLRGHLAYLGWRIESKKDTMIRFRYTAPDGKHFLSLNTVRSYLMKDRIKEENTHAEPLHLGNKNTSPMKKRKLKQEEYTATVMVQSSKKGVIMEPGNKMEDSNSQLNSKTSDPSSSKVVGEKEETGAEPSASRKRDLISSAKSRVLAQSVPDDLQGAIQATQGYCNYMDVCSQKGKQEVPNVSVKLLRSNAKRHLLFKGWNIWLKTKKTKKEMVYDSPEGKSYYSLHTACKGFLEELQLPESSGPRSSNLFKRRKTSKGVPPSGKSESSVKVNTQDRRFGNPIATISGCLEDAELLNKESELHSRGLEDRKKEPLNLSLPPWPSYGELQRQRSHGSSRVRYPSHSSVTASRVSRRVPRSREKAQPVVSFPSQHITRTVWSLLIDADVLLPREKVSYVSKRNGDVLKQGRISRHGIICYCCKAVFTPTNFEAHAGGNSHRPVANIFLRDGRSLLQCLKEFTTGKFKDFPHLRFKSDYSQSTKDSICSICQDGGSLLQCDHCPSAFHKECIGLEVFSHLQNLLGKSNLTSMEGLSWALFRSSRASGAADVESIAECYSKLHVALGILHECFGTIPEPRTNSDLVYGLVFNRMSELKRLNFWGFYTMVIEKGDEFISVAMFRVFGKKVAEMTLIGTSIKYRGQGMCRILVNELEKVTLPSNFLGT